MAHSYVAFIDESGDDGLTKFREPGKQGGASKWLVISACLFRRTHYLDAVSWRNEIMSKIPEKKARGLYFKDLNHNQKFVVSSSLSKLPVRTISVLAAKEPIPPEIYVSKNQLYFYMTRYLLERISWLCRDLRSKVSEGDGRVAITFSRRGGMSYEDFREYLTLLRGATGSDDIRIHWPVIDIDAVTAVDHSKSAALQLADAVASSFAAGVEPNMYGNCELRYASMLKPVTYERNGNYLSYGVKFVPKYTECHLNSEQLEFVNLFGGK